MAFPDLLDGSSRKRRKEKKKKSIKFSNNGYHFDLMTSFTLQVFGGRV